MSNDQDKIELKFSPNENLQTLFVDSLFIRSRTDGFHYVRLATSLPEGFKEQARLIVPDEGLKNMLDVLCSHCNHWPQKSKDKTSDKR